ncbi:MAG: response regulator, partial [Anaerolineales bacterium]
MKSVTTLLADDHAVVRAGLRNALTHLPELEVVGEVGDGAALMDALASLRPDFLVLDVHMPDFEPVEDVRRICERYPALKILVVSAYDDQAYVVGLLAAGVAGYHLKDQPLSDLQFAVRKILAGDRWISGPLINRLVDQAPLEPGESPAPDAPASAPAHPSPERPAPPPVTGPLLTQRQRELLHFLTLGYSNRKMAQTLDLSVKTIENHLTALYRAIDVSSRLEANNYALCHPEVLATPGREMARAKDAAQSAVEQEPSLTVLLVDDSARYRTQLGKRIGKVCPSSSLYEAEDCITATRLARQVQPALAFVDVV